MQKDRIVQYLESLNPQYLVLLVAAGLIGVVLSRNSVKVRWLLLVPLFYTSSLGGRPEDKWWDLTMSPMLQLLENNARIVTMGILHVLLFGLLFLPGETRKKYTTPAVLWLFVLELTFCAKLVYSGLVVRGFFSAYTYTLMFFVFVFGCGGMLRTIEDCYRCLQVYVAAVGLVVLGTLHELVFNPTGVLADKRLLATAGHAQSAGIIFVFAVPAIYVLLTRTQSKTLAKFVLFALGSVVVVFAIWTGSRTAALALIISGAVLFRKKIVSSTLIVVIVAGSVVGLMQTNLLQGSRETSQRLLSTSNTRAKPWQALWNDFRSSPAIGKNLTSGNTKESSILGAGATLGVVGFGLVAMFLAYFAKLFFQLVRISRRMPEHANLINGLLAGFAGMFISWVFDSYLFSVTAIQVLFLYIYLAIASYLVELDKRSVQPQMTWQNSLLAAQGRV